MKRKGEAMNNDHPVISAGDTRMSWCSKCNQATEHVYTPKGSPAIMVCLRCKQIAEEAKGETKA